MNSIDSRHPRPAPSADENLPSSHRTLSAGSGPPPARPPKLRGRRLRKLFSYYRPHVRLLTADLGCALLLSTTTLLLPLCANWVVRRLADSHGEPAVLGPIYVMGAVMLLLLGVQALCTVFVDYQGHVMGAKMETAMRQELFEHYQRLSFSFYDQQRVGQLMSRIGNDLYSLAEAFHHAPEDLVVALLKFSGALAIMFYLDMPTTWVIVALLPFAVAYALHFNVRMNRALRWSKERIAGINERVEETLSGIRVVKSFANEPLEISRFAAENRRFLDTRRAGYKSEALFSVGMTTFAQLVTVLVIVIGAVRITSDSLAIADLLTYLLCVAILVDPIQRVVNIARVWQEGTTSFHRFMEVMEVSPTIRDAPTAITPPVIRGALHFENVSFRYDGNSSYVLRHLNLDVAAGEFVALVGYSGVGKSTLCALIPRFYDVCEGRLRIDDYDVRDLSLESLRRNIGIVQQDVYLFADTVAENIRYGRPGASDAEVVAAARRANAHDFIEALPNGYATDIGERGVKLSGGQKQRLTIARVFLADPPILIFDEATSALDNESERAVQAAFDTLARHRTTLVIAHRLSTVRHADRIIVLTDQGIVEQGSHDALVESGGAYAALYQTQARL